MTDTFPRASSPGHKATLKPGCTPVPPPPAPASKRPCQVASASAPTGPASWLSAGTRDLSIPEQHPPTPGPCPACRRADQAGLAPAELHADCAQQQPAHDTGPDVAECAADDRNWDVQKAGE